MENVLNDPTPNKFNKKQKIILITSALILGAGIIGGGTYFALNGQQTDSEKTAAVISNTSDTITLVEGTNKITSGGTYTITGSISNGKITIDTTEEVKIILKNVTIKNSEGAAIKSKNTNTVTIELFGENTLEASGTEDPAAAISIEGSLILTGDGTANVTSTGKGIKAETDLNINSGNYVITAEDDAIHSNGSITVADGEYIIETGDDAIHAETTLSIESGNINVKKCNEGIEAVSINISGGEINVISSDDGINATNSDGSSEPGNVGDGNLTISGGKIYVNASGDGLDSNGKIQISGGEIYVDGPTNSGNGAIDCDGGIEISGGTLIAVGAAGMAQNATSASQPSVLMNLSSTYSGEFSFGNITYSPTKSYQSILISSPELKTGKTYTLTINGKTVNTVTVSQNITGQGSGMMGGGAPNGMGRR